MNLHSDQVVDEVVAIIEAQAASYRQRLDKMTKLVEEYTRLAEDREKLREYLKVIVDWGIGQEKQGITRDEFVRSINLVLTALFSDPITGQVKIPLSFWQGSLGQLINRGNLRFIPMSITEMLNPSDAAKEAGVSRETIYRWAEQARFFPIWIGGHAFILKFDLDRIVRDMKSKARQSDEESVQVM